MTAGSYNSRERSTDAVYEQVIYPVLKRAQKVGRQLIFWPSLERVLM
jgi:hypothetical protein